MKQIKVKVIIVIAILFYGGKSFSQTTTTILYDTSSHLSTTKCNVFDPPVNVGGKLHTGVIGGATFSAINGLTLPTTYTSSSQLQRTDYRISYPFKSGYNYSIQVTAFGDVTDSFSYPYLGASLFTVASLPYTSTSCGPGDISGLSQLHSQFYIQVNNTSTVFSPSGANFTSPNNFDYLVLEATCFAATDISANVYIQKIKITETPPSSFTLTPSSVNKVCGTALTQTFTVNNVNHTPGVTSYSWNLGPAANGWLYNGSPAPQTISTTADTLALSAIACNSTPLQNINASAVIGSTNYATNASTVSNSLPALSISGADAICSVGSSANYSIQNLPCNASISWSSSYPNIASVPATGNPVTVSTHANGETTLTAVITNACGQPVTLTKEINIGVPTITGTYINTFDNSYHQLGFYPGITNAACTGYYIETNMQISNATTVTWTKISSSGVCVFNQTGNDIKFYLFANTEKAVFKVTATNSCGSTSYEFAWQASNCGGTCDAFVVSPNPTSGSIVNVTVPDITPPCDIPSGSPASTNSTMATNNNLLITQVSVYDNTGNLKKVVKEAGTKQSRINLSGLIPGIYYIDIQGNNNYNERQKFIKQ